MHVFRFNFTQACSSDMFIVQPILVSADHDIHWLHSHPPSPTHTCLRTFSIPFKKFSRAHILCIACIQYILSAFPSKFPQMPLIVPNSGEDFFRVSMKSPLSSRRKDSSSFRSQKNTDSDSRLNTISEKESRKSGTILQPQRGML